MGEVFKPDRKKRLVYRYWNGTGDPEKGEGIVTVDPYKLFVKYAKVQAFIDGEVGVVASESDLTPIKARGESWELVVKQIRELFGLADPTFGADGEVVSGILDDECWGYLTDFRRFSGALKKNTPDSPTSVSNTEQMSLVADSTPPSGSGSSSTATEPSTEEPPQSP